MQQGNAACLGARRGNLELATRGRARTAVNYQGGCSYLAASAAASSAALAAPLGQAGGRPAAAAWEDRRPSGWAADLGEVLRGVRPQAACQQAQASPFSDFLEVPRRAELVADPLWRVKESGRQGKSRKPFSLPLRPTLTASGSAGE